MLNQIKQSQALHYVCTRIAIKAVTTPTSIWHGELSRGYDTPEFLSETNKSKNKSKTETNQLLYDTYADPEGHFATYVR